MPKGPAKFVPKIYGFKIFGMRGSKYELRFDYQGKPINEDEIREVLKKGNNDISEQVLTGLATAAPSVNNQGTGGLNTQGTNAANLMSKDAIMAPAQKPGTKKRIASEDDQMNAD